MRCNRGGSVLKSHLNTGFVSVILNTSLATMSLIQLPQARYAQDRALHCLLLARRGPHLCIHRRYALFGSRASKPTPRVPRKRYYDDILSCPHQALSKRTSRRLDTFSTASGTCLRARHWCTMPRSVALIGAGSSGSTLPFSSSRHDSQFRFIVMHIVFSTVAYSLFLSIGFLLPI